MQSNNNFIKDQALQKEYIIPSIDLTQVSYMREQNDHFLDDVSEIPIINNDIDDVAWDLDNFLDQTPTQISENQGSQIQFVGEYVTETSILEQARELRHQVLVLLETYASKLDKDQKRTLRKEIIKDSQKVKEKLDYLRNHKNTPKYSEEIKQIFRMIQDFLDKFSDIGPRRFSQPHSNKEKQLQETSDSNNKPNSSSISGSFEFDALTPSDRFKVLGALQEKTKELIKNLDFCTDQNAKAFKKLAEIILTINSNYERIFELFKQMRIYEKNIPESQMKLVKKISKACYIKASILKDQRNTLRQQAGQIIAKTENKQVFINSPQMNQQIKNIQQVDEIRRKFYQVAIAMKFRFQKDHPAQRILITTLFDKVQAQNLPENEWENFLLEQYK